MYYCKCGWRIFSDIEVKCPKCGKIGEVADGTLHKPKTSTAWVRWVKLLRKPEDRGVGDTVARIAAKFGGERFKAFSKRIGIPCGCTERQAAWNEQWPY
jgi:hypothetical protein